MISFYIYFTNYIGYFLGRSRQPRCFKNLNVNKLPVIWRTNRTAWMNPKLFSEWLFDINEMMKKQSRRILLFIDNAPCHPVDIQLSNTNIVFFPPNTTSVVQPLDQGVIHSFKFHYRQMVAKHIIAQCVTVDSINEIVITALDAIQWIHQAWNIVTGQTINNCFNDAGFRSIASNPDNFNTNITLIDGNEQQNSIKQLDELLSHVNINGPRMSAIKLINIDQYIPVFNEWDDSTSLLYEFINADYSEENSEKETITIQEPPPKLPEALEMIRRLHLPASTEPPELHVIISQLESKITDIYIDSKTSKQTSITDFFENSKLASD